MKTLSFIFTVISFSSIIIGYRERFEYQVIKNGLLSLNILALNMIDITVRPKVSMPICIELTFTNALWYATCVCLWWWNWNVCLLCLTSFSLFEIIHFIISNHIFASIYLHFWFKANTQGRMFSTDPLNFGW